MRIKTLVAVYFWILEFDDVTCIRSIRDSAVFLPDRLPTSSGNQNDKHSGEAKKGAECW